MAQCKQMPQEFIKNAFTPQIAVMSTNLAEKCWEKNNLNFVELLQPFSRLQNDVHFTDPTGANISIKNFKLSFLDINWKPPQTTLARVLLNTSVSTTSECRTEVIQMDKHQLNIPTFTPWYEAWREIFFKVQYPSDHEFTKHFLACILVISSFDTVDTFGTLEHSLNKMQNNVSGKLPKWFNSHILKYYVIVHDNFEGILADAMKLYETIKAKYESSNCFLLKVNSRSPLAVNSDHLPDPWSQFIDNNSLKNSSMNTELESPKEDPQEIATEAEEKEGILSNHPLSPANDNLSTDNLLIEEFLTNDSNKAKVHGLCLSTDDVEQIKLFVYEFTKSCLIPYVEKQINLLNEHISNKKGVSKSLFSATKRWFSPNKPGLGTSTVNNLIYAPDSQELQVRKLGDLYFMFGQYSAAFNAYHMAKRDYNADQAWLYYAGALEMAALSAFLANETTKKTFDYMEESITIYLNTCKLPQFATRATVLSLECLKHHKMYGEAALQLIRMTSEDSDLRSALLLEQAAFCFLHSKMIRKYAFHMVLAGHRFSKASQRNHSLKCYKEAYQVYQDTTWDLARDHIHYTIGKLANNLQLYNEAVESFSKLLKGESKQSATQQALFLKEYLMILGNKRDSETGQNQVFMPVLPVPSFDMGSLKLLVGPTRPLSTPGKIAAVGINFTNVDDPVAESKWLKLEEMLVQEVDGSQPVLFKPMISLYNISKLEKNTPIAIVNEPVQISIKLTNSLQTSLHLKEIYLLWNFTTDTAETITNELLDDKNNTFIKTYVTKVLSIEGNSTQDVLLSITPLAIGNVTITGISYTLTITSASEVSYLKGKQLIKIPSSSKQGNVEHKHLEIKIVPQAPCLQVTFSDIGMDFLCDELQKVTIDFQNTSSIPLKNIYLATSVPHLLNSCEFKKSEGENVNWNELNTPVMKEKFVRKTHTACVPLLGRILEPGQATTVDLWMKAPNKKGQMTIDLLIYYENILKTNIPKYRLIRHTWNLTVQESVSIDIATQTSHSARDVEELALAMKITNLNKSYSSILTEVTLLSVGLLSKNWTLTKDIVTPKYINLHTQESAHILLKAKRSVRSISEYSAIPLHSDTNYINSLKNTYMALAKSYEKPFLNVFTDDFESFVFKENREGILLFQWQAQVIDGNKTKTVTGQCCRPVEIRRFNEDILDMERILSDPVIDINEKTGPTENNNEAAENQVSYNIICPPIVRHDFTSESLCVVPVKLFLHSIIEDTNLTVVVNTVEISLKPSPTDTCPFSTFGSNNFCWLGNNKIVKTLKPLSSTTVHLLVALSGPGTFNLGANIEVLCKNVEQTEPYVLQTCKIHSAIVVVNMEN